MPQHPMKASMLCWLHRCCLHCRHGLCVVEGTAVLGSVLGRLIPSPRQAHTADASPYAERLSSSAPQRYQPGVGGGPAPRQWCSSCENISVIPSPAKWLSGSLIQHNLMQLTLVWSLFQQADSLNFTLDTAGSCTNMHAGTLWSPEAAWQC